MDRKTNELSPPNLPYMSKQHLEDRVKPLKHLATSFSKLTPLGGSPKGRPTWKGPLPCIGHKRVSQLGMATSFSKFCPWVAHTRVSQLSIATSFSKFFPCIANTKG